MASVPDFRRMTQGDVPGMPPEFYKFMDKLQEQVEFISKALQGRLTLQNVLADPLRDIDLRHGRWQEVKVKNLRTAPFAVAVVWSSAALDAFQWEKIDDTRIQVRALFEDAPMGTIKTILEIRG